MSAFKFFNTPHWVIEDGGVKRWIPFRFFRAAMGLFTMLGLQRVLEDLWAGLEPRLGWDLIAWAGVYILIEVGCYYKCLKGTQSVDAARRQSYWSLITSLLIYGTAVAFLAENSQDGLVQSLWWVLFWVGFTCTLYSVFFDFFTFRSSANNEEDTT